LRKCRAENFETKMTDPNEMKVQELWPDGEGPLRKDSGAASDEALIVDVGGFEGPLDPGACPPSQG
jgi:hypothetical protein